ncbi:toxic anion resistance protein [Latilactobacillus fuchuensis]|uniref:toxic anion resistance protein n=1 Tax=Latilactobacillus fuchuensis TaxID=164393 RepID=UPI0039AF386E
MDNQKMPLPIESSGQLSKNIKAQLTPEELAQAQVLSEQLSVNQQNTVIEYGKHQQLELSSFANDVLGKVKNKDLGEIGDSLRVLVKSLNEANPDKLVQKNDSVFAKLFVRLRTSLFEMTAKYQEVSVQIDNSAEQLAKQEKILLEDNQLLDEMYTQNLRFYQELNVLIVGAQLKDEQLTAEIAELQPTLVNADQMALQQLQDLKAMQDRLSKKANDLLLTREITIQQAPQIRLIQSSNSVLAEKIQASISTVIPLWKNQVGIALALLSQKEALQTQNAVADATNDLLKKNSELLHQSAVEIAQASQRGVVDIETLKETQTNLINTISDVLQIQANGQVQRQTAETELQQLEQNLQAKLTTIEQGDLPQGEYHE